MEISELGVLVSLGNFRGFRINYENSGSLNIQLDENGSDKPFNFMIILHNGAETREIRIEQPVSAGYSFEGIEYFLDENDGGSVYFRKKTTYHFNHISPKDVEIMPFSGSNVVVNSYFESEDPNAFRWFGEGEVEVSVPTNLNGGRVQLSHKKKPYGAILNEPYDADFTITLPTKAGTTKFTTYIEERKRIVSYKIKMFHKSTGEAKEITGKWVEIGPSGKYKIKELF